MKFNPTLNTYTSLFVLSKNLVTVQCAKTTFITRYYSNGNNTLQKCFLSVVYKYFVLEVYDLSLRLPYCNSVGMTIYLMIVQNTTREDLHCSLRLLTVFKTSKLHGLITVPMESPLFNCCPFHVLYIIKMISYFAQVLLELL